MAQTVADRHEGGCRCGRIRYRVSGEPRERFFCHCESCRRCAGASPFPWVTIDAAAFEVAHGEIATFASTAEVLRGLCAACGTALTYRHASSPQELDVTTLSFDDPVPLAPQYHLWVSDQLPWIVIADHLPRYATTREAAKAR
ncbi:MAG TPA: GFA family protein [Steroidobacteraceae bacterium]|nr:GFA family protein [Steroidobacteraceae bacterium]